MTGRHSRIYTYDDMIAYSQMLHVILDIIKQNMDSGLSLDEIRKQDVLKDFKNYAVAFTCYDWIEFIYKSTKKLQILLHRLFHRGVRPETPATMGGDFP